MTLFQESLNYCGLKDLGYSGCPFTWSNMQGQQSNIQERLDIFLATVSWNEMFREAKVTHHDFCGSDHRVLTMEF